MGTFTDFLQLLFFLTIILIFIVASLLGFEKKRNILRKLSSSFKGTVSKLPFTISFKGEYQGLIFSVILNPGSKSSDPALEISLMKRASFTLKLYRESIVSNIGKRLGVVREVVTGDELFDKEFLIISNRATQAKIYLANTNARNAISELSTLGFGSFSIDGKKISVMKSNYNIEEDLNPQKITTILQNLILLTNGL